MAPKRYWRRLGDDLAKWNFVIFLTLSFMLLAAVTYAINGRGFDLRSRASTGSAPCVNPTYPANWKAQKAHCLETEKGTFSWDVDAAKCQLIAVCKTDTVR